MISSFHARLKIAWAFGALERTFYIKFWHVLHGPYYHLETTFITTLSHGMRQSQQTIFTTF